MEILISTVGDKLRVKCASREAFNRQAKSKLRGRYVDGAWEFDSKDETRVRALLKKHFAFSGSYETVDVKITALNQLEVECGPLILAGRVVAAAENRDGGATIGPGVIFEKGKPQSGGSRQCWTTIIRAGAVWEIHQLFETALEDLIANSALSVEVIEKQ